MLCERCFDLLTHLHKSLKSFEEFRILGVGIQGKGCSLFFSLFFFCFSFRFTFMFIYVISFYISVYIRFYVSVYIRFYVSVYVND